MKRLWNVINEMKIKKEIKIKLYLYNHEFA